VPRAFAQFVNVVDCCPTYPPNATETAVESRMFNNSVVVADEDESGQRPALWDGRAAERIVAVLATDLLEAPVGTSTRKARSADQAK